MGKFRACILEGWTEMHTNPLDTSEEAIDQLMDNLLFCHVALPSPTPLDQPSHLLCCDLVCSDNQIAFVFPVLVIENHDKFPFTNVFDGFVYRGKMAGSIQSG